MSNEEKLVSHYQLKTLLRKDGFGAVYLGEDTRDGKAHILRVVELDQQTLARITGRVRTRSQRDHPLIEQIRQRMKRISEMKHPHILPVIEFGEEHIQGNNDIIFYMISPYEKESLLSYWSAQSSAAEFIPLEVIADLVFQAGEALFYVHKRGLTHQYVRLSSFMLRSTTRGRRHLHLLLTDFWFADISAAILEEGQITQDLSIYLAPEQLAGHALAASDQYALALLAYELLLGYRLSQVDLSQGLYEHALRQRSAEVSATELEIAHRLDLVLARALAEDASARFPNIEEFVYIFRAVAHGETVDLSNEETFKLPAAGERRGRKHGEEIVAAAAGALAADEVAGELTKGQMQVDSEVEEQIHSERHPSLHKTVLTSEGMEAAELAAAGGMLEETVSSSRQTASSGGAQSGVVAEEEETVTTIEAEHTRPSAGIAGVAGFAAGLAAGAALQREADIANEQTQIVGSRTAAFTAGEALQREADVSEEQTLIRESRAAAFASGLAAGEALQQEMDISEERTQIIEGGTLAAGGAGLFAAGILVGESGASTGLAGTGEITQVGGASAAGTSTEASAGASGAGEVTQIAGTSGTSLAAGASGSSEATQVAAAGTAGAGIGVLESTQAAGAGAGLVTTGTVTSGGRHRWRRPLIAALLIVLCLFIAGGGVALALLNMSARSSATVTLTLESHTIQNTYLITAVTTTTSQGQIQASVLTQTVSQSKSGQASGYYAGAHATGFITFHNTSTGCGCPIVIPAGTAFTSASGVTVVTATAASVASLCTVTVRAYAAIYGPAGDIPANDIHAIYGAHISASNPYAFSGGQPGQSKALVQQSDINSLASSLQAQTTQSAQAALQSQVKSGQRLASTPLCQSKSSANHAPGDFATSVTVTVTTTCTAEAYDYAGAAQIVQQEVQTQASTYFSSQFVLVGTLQTAVTSATLIDAKAGTLLLAVHASGKWGYRFSNNLKQSLITVIAGKDVNKVRALLSSQNGVSAVNINISGGDQSKLPADASKITIILKD